MVDRIDLLIAVIGIVATVVGSSAPLWMALSKNADKEDLRLEVRMDARFDAVDARFDGLEATFDVKLDRVEARLDTSLARVEGKLDALILRFVPEQRPPIGEVGRS